MIVSRVYVATYKFDFRDAKVCIASIRYWYPDIEIYLIKDSLQGRFNTSLVEKIWNVKVLELERKKFGWGYSKLEPLFLNDRHSFLILDADTVLLGPVIDQVKDLEADFVVDDEVQPYDKFNQLYYNLDRIKELDDLFIYLGYSFNSGQWFGTSAVLSRDDFEKSLIWSEPPKPRYPLIVFNGDQAHLNFNLHRLERLNKVKVIRKLIMLWPDSGNADYLEINSIKNKESKYPFVLHWAGIKRGMFTPLPRNDIYKFYRDYFKSQLDLVSRLNDILTDVRYSIDKALKKM